MVCEPSAFTAQKAKALLSDLEKETEPSQPELVRLRAIIKRLEIIGR